MRKISTQFTAVTLFSIAHFSTAFPNTDGWTAKYESERSFIENRGQYNVRHPFLGSMDIRLTYDEQQKQIHFTPSGLIYHFFDLNKNPDRRKGEKHKPRQVSTHDLITMDWVDCNKNVEIEASEPRSSYSNFSIYDGGKDRVKSFEKLANYKKITYKNLYNGIDLVYEIHPERDVKYSLIAQPGADLSKVKMRYSSDRVLSLTSEGKLTISTKFGEIVEEAPLSFYTENANMKIGSNFVLNGNDVSFYLENYDQSKSVTVDPWIQTPNFNTGWKCVWECETDAAGNAYIIGGVMPLQLLKYNTAGVLQWTYNTPYDTSNTWLGNFATDDAGNSFVTEGTGGGTQRISTAGALAWNRTGSPGGISTEFWSIAFNCDQTKLVIGGTGGALPPVPYMYDMNPANGNVTAIKQVTGGALFPTQEVRAVTACGNGNYYFLSHDSIGYIHQGLTSCLPQGAFPFHVSNGYSMSYKCENWRKDNSGIAAMKYYGGFVYTHRGDRLDKRAFATAAIVQSVSIPGGQWGSGQVRCSGIDIDDCGNIYVGATNGVVKFNSNLVQQATYPTSFVVYDVAIGTNGEIIAAGSTGTSSSGNRTGSVQSFAASACAKFVSTCCDATICQVPQRCTTDPPVTLNPTTPGGTFSGPGVVGNTFNPAVAGVGTHTIRYTLPCGSDSIQIVVNLCTPLSVCRENNGNLTVSGGTPVYTWSYWQAAQTSPITNQAQCTACGGSWIPFVNTCTIGGVPSTSCNAPAQWVQFGTGTSVTPPAGRDTIRVVDNAGTQFVINGIATVQPCTPCPTITVTVQSKQDVTCPNPNSGSATFTASGGTGAYTYSWSGGGTGATRTNLTAGTYTVTATDANGCSGTGTVTINPSNNPTLSFSNQVNPGCGQNNGSVNATLGGGVAPYVVTIDNGQGNPQTQNVPVAGTAPLTGLAAGTYTITVRDANNCTTSQTLTLTPPNAPTINPIAVTNEVCAGQNNGSITNATATGGTGTLQWSYAPAYNPSNITNISAFPLNNLAPGNYILTVRDANNCTATANFTIAAGPNCCNISLSISKVEPACGQSNGQITVTPSPAGNYNYAWSGSLPNQATQNGLAAGQYTVTVSETGNPSCNKDTIINLSNSNGPNITFANKVDPGCGQSNGSVSITLAGGTAPYTVNLNGQTQVVPIAGTLPATGIAAGTYNVSVTDALGCSAVNSITFTEPLAPVITSINATAESCLGDNDGTASVTVIGGNGALVYSWSNSGTNATISNLAPGSYSVTITDAQGCSTTGNVVVSAGPVCCTVNIGATLTQPACGANDGSIILSVTPNAANYSYNWSNGANTPTITGLSAGQYCVTVTNTDNGCSEDTCFNLSNPNSPTIGNVSTVAESCNGNDGSATVTASGGSGTLTITWSNLQTGNTISNLAAGSYTFTVSDANGCVAVGSAVVAPPTGCCFVQVSATATDASCSGNDGTITASIANPGTPPYEYSINGTNFQSSPNFTGVAQGSYFLTVRDANGCKDSVNVIVGVANNSLNLSLAVVEPGCAGANGGSVTANVTGGTGNITYQWSVAGSGNSISGLAAGTYSVTITDGNNCTQTASATLIAAQPVVVSIGNDVAFCEGESRTISAPAGFSAYLWSTGETTPSISVDGAGVYSITVTNSSGCTATDALVATTYATPQISLPTDTTIYENNAVLLNPVITGGSASGAKYFWNPDTDLSCNDCTNPVANPSDTITYTLAYTSANNCSANAQITINVLKGALIYMPNVFSPNGDGNNDFLLPLGIGVKSIVWKVFNRWGEKVFEGTDMNIGWDGNYKGVAQPQGVFVYTMQVTFLNNTARNYNGSVTLIR